MKVIYLSVILGIATIYSISKWISYFYGLAGMIHYMEENNMKPPTDEEIKKAIKWCVEKSFNSLMVKYKFLKLKYFTRIHH
ncbi:hypothetical protein [Clostridium sp. YIM B02555]|uniref:hypothetical protein n=1 Tax=Clostridium sp. YIM B02555 TaxID=2911968 RepID=UPI001EEE0AE2|nr:hypothetical protein [Clostridium sp. YIM B02555]